MAVPGQRAALNVLHWTAAGDARRVDLRDRVVPEQLQPDQTAFEHAEAAGVEVVRIGPRDHARSGLTRAVLRGGSHQTAVSLGDLGGLAVRALTAGGGRRRLVYAYHRDLDLTGHARGGRGLASRLQLRTLTCSPSSSPHGCLAVPSWWSPATTAWSMCDQLRRSTLRTIPTWPLECARSPARPAPATSTQSTARQPTCWLVGYVNSGVVCELRVRTGAREGLAPPKLCRGRPATETRLPHLTSRHPAAHHAYPRRHC